jgi:phenylpropionate dioxygenase-like ring-hydroxylating dioxygenase large terminal subunit
MLSREENELLCRVGAGTPMGEMFRRYWIPAGISREIPEPDSPPVRVRLLGEDLVLFRDTNGRVGLVAEKCAHRRASLFFGRNEECGLRCIYHGWKYDVDGNIVDTPAEPEASMIKHHVKHTAYPTHEVNGLILTYMGPREKMPLIPNFAWLTLPQEHVTVGDKFWNENNWLQGVEGDCDSSHIDYLHRRAGMATRTVGQTLQLAPGFGQALDFDVKMEPWGVFVGATRYVGENHKYVRSNSFVPPCIGLPPTSRMIHGIVDGFHAVYQVPADDYNTWRIDVNVRVSGPLRQGGGEGGEGRGSHEVGSDWRKFANKANDYLVDRVKQKNRVYSGVDFGNHTQDACVTESMGGISDRENEHLGACDAQPIAMRQFLLAGLKAMERGEDPPGVAFEPAQNPYAQIFTVNATIPRDLPWNDRRIVEANAVEPAPYY